MEKASVSRSNSRQLSWGESISKPPLEGDYSAPPLDWAGAAPNLHRQWRSRGHAVPSPWRVEDLSDFLPCSRAPLGVSTGHNPREAQEDARLCSFTKEKMEAGRGVNFCERLFEEGGDLNLHLSEPKATTPCRSTPLRVWAAATWGCAHSRCYINVCGVDKVIDLKGRCTLCLESDEWSGASEGF